MDSITKIGGKAYNLVHLNQISEICVPNFIILDTSYFSSFIKNIDLSRNNSAIQKQIANSTFDNKTKQKILDLIGNNLEGKVSVRSSATIEDSSAASFAGMFESYLDIDCTEEAIFDAIKKCYQSCFTEQVVKYCEQINIPITKIKMAVVIQQMIHADYSGVMFTANYQTNNTDEIIINVVKGAGENLVSGKENSRNYTLNLANEIIETEGDSHIRLNNDLIVALGNIGRIIENSYEVARPVDIEFSIKSNKIYILQCRPISSLSYINKRLPRTIFDNSNIIESYSGTTTPLTYSFASEVYAKVYRQTLKTFYIKDSEIARIKPDLDNMLAFYENKIYYRLNSWYKMTAMYPGYEKNRKYMENMMGVKVSVNETASEKRGRMLKTYLHMVHGLIHSKGDSKKFLQKFEAVTGPYYGKTFEGYSSSKLVKVYHQLEKEILDDFTTPIFNDMATMVFFGVLCEKARKLHINNADNLVSSVLGQRGQLESAAQVTELFSIVRDIKSDPTLFKLFSESDCAELAKELIEFRSGTDYGILNQIFSKISSFLDRFGPRQANELKLETITMIEQPDMLFELIREYLQLELKPQNSEVKDIAVTKFLSQLSWHQKITVKPLLNLTRYFIKNRESLRLRRTYIFSIVRNIFLQFGNNFAEQGTIKEPRDIFFLTKKEIFSFADMGSEQLSEKAKEIQHLISQRKRELQINTEKSIQERMYFYGEVSEKTMVPIFSKQEKKQSSNILKGIGGGGGVVVGTVKFVKDPSHANVRGHILMAERTDPGWTPIFPLAEAIIVERGSALSHSAVVARELGETVVVGVRGLTQKIHDGDKVSVDGLNGTIEILESNNHE